MSVMDFFKGSAVATTVCDIDGNVIYQNDTAKSVLGDAIGRNLKGCHKPESWNKIVEMLTTGTSNAYTIEKGEIKKLIYQTPWYDSDGKVAGLIEYSVILPNNMPHFVRPVK